MNSLGPLEDATAYKIYRLSRLLRIHLRKVLNEGVTPLTPEQYFLLYKLSERDGITQAELADNMLGDYPNMTRMIDGMEKKGFVQRKVDANDRRRHLVYLTSQGSTTMQKLAPRIQDERTRLFGQFDEKELAAFRHFINRVEVTIQQR